MKRTRLLTATLLTAGVMALAACGGSSGSAASAPTATPAATTKTIVAVASNTRALSTLVSAVQAADLVSTLEGTGPFTVFAPTNDAFAALPAGTLEHLLLPCNKDALTKILTYHVVAGKVTAADIKPGDVATVEGQTVKLTTGGTVTVNGANVITADVQGSNGVVHVIDKALVPSDVDVSSLKTSC